MGLGKITRGLGKVGLAFEALGYVWSAGGALVKAIKGKPSAGDRPNSGGDPHSDTSHRHRDNQPELKGDE
ncbi:hypothetical protein [Sphingobium yanoikuyae]|uniref:hypothetical protein n=1 Tax=Sphingobium yanoikuyae TaxID=13690 RepID=UPI0028A82828|nr:hypothetical protein [Sphingobium yanoikuyae]